MRIGERNYRQEKKNYLSMLTDHVVRFALPKRTLESCDKRNSMGLNELTLDL